MDFRSVVIELFGSRAAGSLIVTGGITLLLWLALRSGRVRDALPPALRYWIWWVVCLRFALVFVPVPAIAVKVALPSHAANWLAPLSFRDAFAHPIPQIGSKPDAALPRQSKLHAAVTVAGPPKPARAPATGSQTTQNLRYSVSAHPGQFPLVPIVQLIWACGVALCLLRSLAATSKIHRLIRAADTVRDPAALRLLDEVWSAPNPPRLIAHPNAASPLAAAWGKPVILVPSWLLNQPSDVVKSILAHEARHLKRRDLWLGIVPWLCRIALWWFPLASLAASECARCAEEDCDLQAVRGASSGLLRSYAELLIRLASSPLRNSPAAAPVGAECLASGYKSLRERLLAMKRAGGAAAPTSSACAVAAIAACAFAASVPSVTLLAASRIASAARLLDSAPLYTLVDLGDGNAPSSSAAESISDSGAIAGYETLLGRPGLTSIAWRGGRAQPVAANLGFPSSRAVAINAEGDVALSAFGLLKYQHAAIATRRGDVLALQTPRGYHYAVALALNDRQTAAGYVYSGTRFGKLQSRAALWSQYGGVTDLGTLGGPCSQALGLNAAGDVVGKADLAQDGITHAFLAPASAGRLIDLGALNPQASSAAYAVNRRGAAVGYSATDDPLTQHAVIWPTPQSQPVDLGALQPGGISKARSINDRGEIVGVSTNPGGSGARAALWRGTQIYDLNACLAAAAPGWTLRYAVGINNAGQIVGVGQKNGATRAFLLNPAKAAR